MNEHAQDELVSVSLKIEARYRDIFKALAKSYKISQPQVLEVFLDEIDHASLRDAFMAKVGAKPERRGAHMTLAKKLKELSPEQIAYLESLK